MFCENCGAPVLDDAKFCPACGEPVNATSAAASEPQPVQIQPAPAPQPAPQGAPTPPPMPGAVELDRNFGMILLLAIVTCGIYGIYAYYKISEDVATMCSGDGDDMPNYLIAILLSFITCASMACGGHTVSAIASRPTVLAMVLPLPRAARRFCCGS